MKSVILIVVLALTMFTFAAVGAVKSAFAKPVTQSVIANPGGGSCGSLCSGACTWQNIGAVLFWNNGDVVCNSSGRAIWRGMDVGD